MTFLLKLCRSVDLAPFRRLEQGGNMARLVRLDRSGNTELAAWSDGDEASFEHAAAVFREQLAVGYMGVAKLADSSYEQVKDLPADVDLVMLRRPIAGG